MSKQRKHKRYMEDKMVWNKEQIKSLTENNYKIFKKVVDQLAPNDELQKLKYAKTLLDQEIKRYQTKLWNDEEIEQEQLFHLYMCVCGARKLYETI